MGLLLGMGPDMQNAYGVSTEMQAPLLPESAQPVDLATNVAIVIQEPRSNGAPVPRSVFIVIPDSLKTLERAPVLFPHDVHTAALTNEGCQVCHPDEKGTFAFSFPKKREVNTRKAFMNSFHDACITCHNQRKSAGHESGPVTCGECHADRTAYHATEYLPKTPAYYEALRDTYHRDCMACHQSSRETKPVANALDWKNFYVREKERIAVEFPRVYFDYYLHNKHTNALAGNCALCHYLPPELKARLETANQAPTCQDWLREVEQGKDFHKPAEAHAVCINCHLKLLRENRKAGPTSCGACHTGTMRSIAEMKDVPRPEGLPQKERFLIALTNDSRMNGVPFDHKAHHAVTRGCQDCHHDTMEACRTCHTTPGDKRGKFITLAEAFHAPASPWSCIGCHVKEQQKPDCAGCHSRQASGLVQSACATCHSGSLETLAAAATRKADPATYLPANTTNEMVVKVLEKEYEPAKFKHQDMVRVLTEIVNRSRLATYFHADTGTICQACHHRQPVEKNRPVAACRTCHTSRQEPLTQVPTLLGAYHQQCLGCHQAMNRPEKVMPQQCAGCHKEKAAVTNP